MTYIHLCKNVPAKYGIAFVVSLANCSSISIRYPHWILQLVSSVFTNDNYVDWTYILLLNGQQMEKEQQET